MKKFLFAIILLLTVGSAYSQNYAIISEWSIPLRDTLISGTDSLIVDTLSKKYSRVYCNISDTQVTARDSVAWEVYNKRQNTWTRIGAIDCATNATVFSGAATIGSPKVYLLQHDGINIIRQRLLQGTYRAGCRTFSNLDCVNR